MTLYLRSDHGLADGHRTTVGLCRSHDRRQDAQVVQPLGQARAARQLVKAGNLLKEGARLVGEEIALTVADAGEVHRQASFDVRVVRPDEDPTVSVHLAGRGPVGDGEFRRPGQVERGRATGAEHLEAEAVFYSVGDSGHRERARGTV